MICETMSLYTGNLTEIGWNNVEAYCDEGIQENRTLDYKEEFPSHLENTIAAMANTFGGVETMLYTSSRLSPIRLACAHASISAPRNTKSHPSSRASEVSREIRP